MINLDEITLGIGSHKRPEDGMCVMEAASLLAGEKFSDNPKCVSPVIGKFLRVWNDTLDDDRQALKRFIPLVVGTNAGQKVNTELAWMVLDWLTRVQTPAWLRAAGFDQCADRLAGLPEITLDTSPKIDRALSDIRLAVQAVLTDWINRKTVTDWEAAVIWAFGAAAGTAAFNAAPWKPGCTIASDALGIAMDAAKIAGFQIADREDGVKSERMICEIIGGELRPIVTVLQADAHRLVDRMISAAKAAQCVAR